MRRPNVVIDGVRHARVRGGLSGTTRCGVHYTLTGPRGPASSRAEATKADVDCMACISAGEKDPSEPRGWARATMQQLPRTATGRMSSKTAVIHAARQAGKTEFLAWLAEYHKQWGKP